MSAHRHRRIAPGSNCGGVTPNIDERCHSGNGPELSECAFSVLRAHSGHETHVFGFGRN